MFRTWLPDYKVLIPNAAQSQDPDCLPMLIAALKGPLCPKEVLLIGAK